MRISFEWRTTVVESQDLTDYEQVRDSPLHSENVCHTFFVLCAARFSICLRAKSVPLFMYSHLVLAQISVSRSVCERAQVQMSHNMYSL